jgi:DNA-binding LacI/PurR family transcriptional regulator
LRGYRTEEFWLHRDGMSNESFSEMLHARGIRGLLLSPLAEGDPTPALRWEYFSTVGLSVPLPSLSMTTVCNDHYFSALRTVRECHARGYRRPGLLLLRNHRTRFQGRWEAGFRAAADLVGGIDPLPALYVEDWSRAADVARWLRREKPDVIVTPSADVIPAALALARRRVPEDLGLALLACPEAGDPPAGIYQNGRLIGGLAVDALLGMVERHERGLPAQATTLMVEGQWNEGRTLPPR